MAPLTHLDTHVLVWLYLADLDRFSERAKAAINEGDLAISPIVLLELTYLKEIGRLSVDAETIFVSIRDQLGLRIDELPFASVIRRAQELSWTRDPFDRLIAAQAIAASAALLTADESLRGHVQDGVW